MKIVKRTEKTNTHLSINVSKPEQNKNFPKPTPMSISTWNTVPRNANFITNTLHNKTQPIFLSEELFNL